jgi:flavin-dependent dehydrogenase
VGGGISGMSAALSIKKRDHSIKVTIYEKHKIIGYNSEGRRCAEAHSIEEEWCKWIPEKSSYFNNILEAETIIGNKVYKFQREIGTAYILNRQEFICQLATEVERLGVEIKTNYKIKTLSDLEADVIVDASGCPSTLKNILNLRKGITSHSYQQTLEDANCYSPNKIKIIYIGEYGYFWIFPRNPEKREVNVGVGLFIKGKYNLKDMLENFKKENDILGKINHVTGGPIPLGLQRPLIYRNILFVGDAGVGTFPFTGQGIYRALISGDVAGRCISDGKIKKYPYIINKMFIKWDTIGKTIYQINKVFKEINPDLVLSMLNAFSKTSSMLHL